MNVPQKWPDKIIAKDWETFAIIAWVLCHRKENGTYSPVPFQIPNFSKDSDIRKPVQVGSINRENITREDENYYYYIGADGTEGRILKNLAERGAWRREHMTKQMWDNAEKVTNLVKKGDVYVPEN